MHLKNKLYQKLFNVFLNANTLIIASAILGYWIINLHKKLASRQLKK